MEYSTNAPNERVCRITQLAKLSFNHPSVVLTADVFQYFYKKIYIYASLESNIHLVGVSATVWKYLNSKFGSCVAGPAAHVQTIKISNPICFRRDIASRHNPVTHGDFRYQSMHESPKTSWCGRRWNLVWTLLAVWRIDQYLRHRLIRFLSRDIARTRSPVQS